MNKKILLIIAAILMVAIAGATTTHFLFPYEPTQPPDVKDVNITENDTENDNITKHGGEEGNITENDIEDGNITKHDVEDVNITENDVEDAELANNMFGFDMLNKLLEEKDEENGNEDENIFYSPYSIFSALAMTYEGARGQTAEEMESVFYFPEKEKLRSGFAYIYNQINDEDRNYELRTGNALWIQEDYELLDEYMQTIEDYYGGKSTNLDFANQNEESRQTINTFIEEQTNDRIKNLIRKGQLPKDTKLVLTNAIYFKDNWKWEFDKENTRNRSFWVTPDESVEAEMMRMNPEDERFNYTETEKLQMIELPYEGGDVSMFIILPKDEIDDISHKLNNEDVEELMDEMRERELSSISIPKFKFETRYVMSGTDSTLARMGMPKAFTPIADFSGITGERELFIDSVIHQAFVEVDETGTEAAAATAVIMVPESYVPGRKSPPRFIADNPFVFFIRDNETGTNLFTGIVKDPTK